MYVSGHVDIFDMVDIDLFIIVALNMMVVKLGDTGESEPLFYNYLRPLTSLDEGLYALAFEEYVCCLATLIRSFKLIEVYIEHGVTALDSYIRPPRFRATIKEITDDPGSIAPFEHRSEKISGLSHDESFGVDDLDVNLNEPINLNVSQIETQYELPVFEEPDVGRTQEPILAEVRTQEPIVEEVRTQEPTIENVILEDYISSGEYTEQGNGQEDESAHSDRQFFYDDEGIDTTYRTEYDVQSSEDVAWMFLLITLVSLDVDAINADGFDSDPSNDDETSDYRRRRLAELSREMEGVINASGQWKMEAEPSGSSGPSTRSKKRKNAGTNDDSQACSSVLDAHDKEDLCPWALCVGKNKHTQNWLVKTYRDTHKCLQSREIEHCTYKFLYEKIFDQVRVNPDIPVKAVQDHLQCDLEVQISMSKVFRDKAEREIRADHVFQRIYVCLGALKLGFRACRRDLLGLDGAFMKGPFPGQVLAAVGLDSNNGIYPLAYFLVEAKMIDKRSASATSVKEFEKCMLEPKKMNLKAHEWLKKIPPEHWARSYFSGRAKSDLLLNDICEVFNGNIVRGRDKPVITLLEYISGNNAEASGSASRQAQQTKLAVGQDGSGGSGIGVVIGLSDADGQVSAGGAGVGVGSQVPVTETRNADGRETGDGIPTQSSAAVSDNGKFPMVDEEDLIFKKILPMAEEIMVMLREGLEKNCISPSDSHPAILITKNMSAVSDNSKFLMVDEEDAIFKKNSPMAEEIMTLRIPPHLPEYQLFYGAWPFEQYQQDLGLGGGGYLRDYVRVVAGTEDGGTTTTTLTAKLPILNLAEYDLWLMRIEQYFLMTDYFLWEVIKNGNKVLKRTVGTVERIYEPTSAEEKLDRKNEMKARGTLLMALPNKDQLKFHSYQDANLLMEAIEKRLQKLISQLEIQGEVIRQEDINLKLLRSLPSEWKTHALIWRNKAEIETISLDDLYNNLKIYEPELTGSSNTSQNPQNVAFVSSNSTNSTIETDNIANGVSAAHTHGNTVNSTSVDNLSDVVICAFLASQPNSPQLAREDLEQIDPGDLEEMDLHWEMAMLTIRAKRFIKRTGRNLDMNGQRIGFDRSKVECFNCHKNGHFARECRAPKNQEYRGREYGRKTILVKNTTKNAFIAQDGIGGYDWSYQADEEHPTNFALMAYM
ncbi:putative ribonuclease H-like domain-containing protein [Tanacetum coccineum]